MDDLRPVRRLARDDDLGPFDSTEAQLDDWLRQFAFSDQQSNVSVTYVLPRGSRIVGFYTLASHAINRREHPLIGRLGKGQPAQRDIPVFLLARLALDKSEHGHRLGGDLLRDALLRCFGGSEVIGARAVVVHAKHERAAAFYERFEFSRLPENDLLLYMLMKDIGQSIWAAR